ncbi:hypothetical protein L204_103431 [Cryptococcus depauperatus]
MQCRDAAGPVPSPTHSTTTQPLLTQTSLLYAYRLSSIVYTPIRLSSVRPYSPRYTSPDYANSLVDLSDAGHTRTLDASCPDLSSSPRSATLSPRSPGVCPVMPHASGGSRGRRELSVGGKSSSHGRRCFLRRQTGDG